MKSQEALTAEEEKFFRSFTHPMEIQRYLDALRYNDTYYWKSPRYILRVGTANCGEGAYLAAAIMKFMGYKPLVVEMSVDNDDAHMLAVYQRNGCWGSIGKSNTTLLRSREPVFQSIRELVMSYFEFYFNVQGFKTLRGFTQPVNVDDLEPEDWITTDVDLDPYFDQYTKMPYETILTEEMLRDLSPAEPVIMKACFLGASKAGLYVPPGVTIDECLEKVEK